MGYEIANLSLFLRIEPNRASINILALLHWWSIFTVSNISDSPQSLAPKARASKSKRSPKQPAETWNYEATVQQVEQIVAQIEAGDLQLAEVFDQFSAAVEQLHQCEVFLAQRQKQVELLIETLTDEPEF
jgi:exodeoxyribonuclease VII small subunit